MVMNPIDFYSRKNDTESPL